MTARASVLLCLLTLSLTLISGPPPASAEGSVLCDTKMCFGEDGREVLPPGKTPSPPPPPKDPPPPGGGAGGNPGSEEDTPVDKWKDEVDEINDANQKALDKYKNDIGAFIACQDSGTAAPCGDAPSRPDLEDLPPRPEDPGGDTPEPDVPVVTPPEAAWIAISTELILPSPTPGIGPNPTANRWKMAVVGYPYWLWADGDTEASAEASAAGLHVSLNADVSSLVFDMGDGTKVKCKGTGTKWSDKTSSSAPTESPSCGYRWKKMSGKDKTYTVTMTAYWEVDWVAGDSTGTEYLVTTATRQVPVGELQTVVDG